MGQNWTPPNMIWKTYLNPKKVESIHPDYHVLETGTVWHPIFSKDVQGQLWWYNMV